jgi:hypothetical protein
VEVSIPRLENKESTEAFVFSSMRTCIVAIRIIAVAETRPGRADVAGLQLEDPGRISARP